MPVTRRFDNGVEYLSEKNGNTYTLLNQQGKIGKFSMELKDKQRYTNDGQVKTNQNGEPTGLTSSQAAYRIGYLNACKDSAKIFKKKNPKYERKTKTLKTPFRYGFPPKK